MASLEPTTVYVYLPDEAVDVWRPVQAEPLGKGRFRILSENEDPEDEKWEFGTGDIVCCVEKTLVEGTTPVRCLVAVSRAE